MIRESQINIAIIFLFIGMLLNLPGIRDKKVADIFRNYKKQESVCKE